MGILLKDQKILYGSDNLGVIEADGGIAPDVTPVLTKSLPDGAFAVYDKRTAPVAVTGVSGAFTWADQSGNNRPMKIYVDDQNTSPSSLWVRDHLVCGKNLRSVRGETTNQNGTTPVSGFTPGSGYTLNALVEYTEATYRQGDPLFKPNGANGLNHEDIVFSLGSRDSTQKRSWYGIGARWNSDNVTEQGANRNRMFYYGSDGTEGEWKYSDFQASSLSGVHLLTWVVNMNSVNPTCEMYYDGTFLSSYLTSVITKTIAGLNPNLLNLFYFAPHHQVSVDSNVFNFFGSVYAISVYNRALGMSDVIKCAKFYQELYQSTHYKPYIPAVPASGAALVGGQVSETEITAILEQIDEMAGEYGEVNP